MQPLLKAARRPLAPRVGTVWPRPRRLASAAPPGAQAPTARADIPPLGM